MNNIFVKDRRVTPALRSRLLRSYVSAALRPERKRVRRLLRSYVSAALRPERKRVRDGYIVHSGSVKRIVSEPAEKKAPVL